MSEDTSSFTFAALDARFPRCDAGAHVEVHLPNGCIRNYSLIDWAPDGAWVTIAVKAEPEGRGGSLAMHRLELGEVLGTGALRNNFPLQTEAQSILLIGGGIGVTPIYAMARVLRAAGRPFDLYYMVKTRALAAFDAAFMDLDLGDAYHLCCDDTDGLPDFARLFERRPDNVHVYVCGPEAMLNAVLDASRASGTGTVFFERFSAVAGADDRARQPFRVELSSTGEELGVPPEKSILQVLRDAGHDVDYACSEGVCGSCIVDVLEGEIDHRDSILTDEERLAGDCMCICVSRARGSRLVLDL